MRKSKASLTVELTGPSEAVDRLVGDFVSGLRRAAEAGGVQVNYPDPCRITPILRNRKPKGTKPERKARKANSQQQSEGLPASPLTDPADVLHLRQSS